MKPDVSIVLVTYNRAEFLPRTLDCVLNQTYSNFELFICDDRSSDATPEVGRAYQAKDQRIRYVQNAVNLGMPGNLNAGLKRANGEFAAILHDGDIYDPTIIEKLRKALIEHPSAGFVFNMYRHLAPDGQSGLVTPVYPNFMRGKEFLEDLCFRDSELECPVWGTTMVRRRVVEELGYFDPKYGFWSDFDMWFRIAEKYDVAFVAEKLIDLPSRKAMPHLFDSRPLKAHSTIFRMYWAARRRHYRGKPGVLARELGKQTKDFAVTKTRRVLRRLKASR
jgi:glycosyltransferase involved in cell wall biosynthesis